ncbi:Conserved hypothetical protein [Clostridium neonatale]|nr:Conserved hypothetical protein [Clostridium neonatale]
MEIIMLIIFIAIVFIMFLLYSWLNISIKEIKKQLDSIEDMIKDENNKNKE